jgi:predicted permease
MENLILAFDVVLPLFLMMALGYFIKCIKMVDDGTLKKMNNVVFRVFLPILLFYNIVSTDLTTAFNGPLILTAVLFVLGEFGLCMIVVPLVEKEKRRRGVLIQGIMRSNFVIFGLPVLVSLCGEGSNTGAVSLVIAVVVPMFNAFSVIGLEINRGGRLNFFKILKSVAANPLIIASVLGLVMLALGLKLPQVLLKPVGDLAKVATPLALVILGAEFNFSSIKGCARQLVMGVTGRLVVMPLIFLTIAILLGFRGEELIALMVMLAAPPAVSSFTMAQQMDGDSELAGGLVVFGSLFAVLTMFLWIFALKTLALI